MSQKPQFATVAGAEVAPRAVSVTAGETAQLPAQDPCPRCGVPQCEPGEGPTTACEQCGHEFEITMNDWLTDETVHRWMREWSIRTEHQPEYGETPYQCVATRGGDEVAAQHIDPWGAIKAACTLCITRELWRMPV